MKMNERASLAPEEASNDTTKSPETGRKRCPGIPLTFLMLS